MELEKRIRLRAITVLYFMLAIADEEFHLSEAESIILKLEEWSPEIKDNELLQIINEVQELVINEDQRKLFDTTADLIKKKFDLDNKVNIIRDLTSIAMVDNNLSKYEFNMIQTLVAAWALADKVNIVQYADHLKVMNEVARLEKVEMAPHKENQIIESKIKEADLDDEIIAEVYKESSNYKARLKDTEQDITEIIDNPSKLQYAFERSGLVRGRKGADGIYVWRVISNNQKR